MTNGKRSVEGPASKLGPRPQLTKVAIGLVAILATAGAILIWQGVGSDDERVWPVEWKVERPLGPKQVRLSVPIEYCIWKAPRFEEPIVEYDDDRAYIEMRLVPEPEREGPSGCFLNLPIAHPTITLERNLDQLILFDSSSNPPQRRWPRERPSPGR